jgi:hypothetical protein
LPSPTDRPLARLLEGGPRSTILGRRHGRVLEPPRPIGSVAGGTPVVAAAARAPLAPVLGRCRGCRERRRRRHGLRAMAVNCRLCVRVVCACAGAGSRCEWKRLAVAQDGPAPAGVEGAPGVKPAERRRSVVSAHKPANSPPRRDATRRPVLLLLLLRRRRVPHLPLLRPHLDEGVGRPIGRRRVPAVVLAAVAVLFWCVVVGRCQPTSSCLDFESPWRGRRTGRPTPPQGLGRQLAPAASVVCCCCFRAPLPPSLEVRDVSEPGRRRRRRLRRRRRAHPHERSGGSGSRRSAAGRYAAAVAVSVAATADDSAFLPCVLSLLKSLLLLKRLQLPLVRRLPTRTGASRLSAISVALAAADLAAATAAATKPTNKASTSSRRHNSGSSGCRQPQQSQPQQRRRRRRRQRRADATTGVQSVRFPSPR